MPTYYVRLSGSDSNAGTSTGAAWRTIGKALGASGAVSGDTVYVGSGVYYEGLIVNAAAASVTVIGDTLGQYTGDAPGEVIVTPFSGPYYRSSSAAAIDTNGIDGLTFERITAYGGNGIAFSVPVNSENITIRKCVGISQASDGLRIVAAYNTNTGVVIEDGYFLGAGSGSFGIQVLLTRGGVADYDANIQIRRCVAIAVNRAIRIDGTGAGANLGGGVDVVACTSTHTMDTGSANVSLSVPNTFQDCIIFGSLNATSAGQITDLGGNLVTGTMTNVTTSTASRASNTQILQGISLGHEWLYGLPIERPFAMKRGFGAFGIAGAQTVDMGNTQSNRDGLFVYGGNGTATAGTTSTLTDSGKAWGVNQWAGWLVRVTGGTGSGQVKRISSNTATALTVSGAAPAGGLWATTPSTDSTYIIYQGPPVETGKATAGAATSLTDSGATWATDQWAGFTLEILAGTGSGQTKTVSSNTATALTVSAWGTNPDNTSTYALYKSSLTAVSATPGAISAHNTARPQTTVLNGGSTGFVLDGYASQDFLVPVNIGTTTISVPVRYDTNHGTSTKPQISIIADGSLGISGSTSTMTAAADTWESVAVSFTATTAGYARIRVQARSSTPYGRTYIDGGAWRFGGSYGTKAHNFQLRPVSQ